MENKRFDIAVIGAGPGGYVAAIKAAQNGRSVCLIEKQFLGGVCLNVGCIPTKTLLSHAHVMHMVKTAHLFGIDTGPISYNFEKIYARKTEVITKIRKNLEGLLLANKITILKGKAEFTSPTEIKVQGEDNLFVSADKFIIATGSEPLDIPAFPCDHAHIFNSSSILEWTSLPKSLAIVGGGYIGCEFASLYAAFGVKVTILEALDGIVVTQGKQISDALTRAFMKKGIDIQTNVRVEGIDKTDSGLSVRLQGKPPLECERALVSIGRKISTGSLGLEKAGVLLDSKGGIDVNAHMETNVPGIYAIGDVTGKWPLAHVASHQGITAASHATGHKAHMDYKTVPAVIFTSPEIATVGMTLEQALQAGHTATLGTFPFLALGKAVASGETEGFAQMVVDKNTGAILGAQVVGEQASTLIAEMALAIHNELTVESIIDTIHAHPTLAEAWPEAAFMAMDMPLHFPPKHKK